MPKRKPKAKRSNQWKQAEREVAAVFGARRRPLSGGNQGQGRDDAIHERLFVSTKYAKRHGLWSLFRTEKPKAKKEGKTVVLGLREKGVPGTLVCIHSDDLPVVLAAYMMANVDAANAILRELGVNIEIGEPAAELSPKEETPNRAKPKRTKRGKQKATNKPRAKKGGKRPRRKLA